MPETKASPRMPARFCIASTREPSGSRRREARREPQDHARSAWDQAASSAGVPTHRQGRLFVQELPCCTRAWRCAMAMSRDERESFLGRYEAGPALLRQAWSEVPAEARQWRPAEGKWSAHEVVVHCADSETYGAIRI